MTRLVLETRVLRSMLRFLPSVNTNPEKVGILAEKSHREKNGCDKDMKVEPKVSSSSP